MSYHDHSSTWFLAQVKPNGHALATRNLARQGFGTFLPLQEQTRRIRGKFVKQTRPLFPGYLFVALDMALGKWNAVNSTYGVSRLVCFGKEPAPVPRNLIGELMRRCDAEGRLVSPDMFKAGDTVSVTQGPFADFVAKVEGEMPDRRIWVLMELMGAQTRVALPAAQLRAI